MFPFTKRHLKYWLSMSHRCGTNQEIPPPNVQWTPKSYKNYRPHR